MKFDLKDHGDILEVTTSGDATLQGYRDFTKALVDHEAWKPGGRLLLNHMKLNSAPLTMDDVEAIGRLSGKYKEQLGSAKVAVVTGQEVDSGLARAWQSMVEIYESWYASEQIFRSRQDAIAWLK